MNYMLYTLLIYCFVLRRTYASQWRQIVSWLEDASSDIFWSRRKRVGQCMSRSRMEPESYRYCYASEISIYSMTSQSNDWLPSKRSVFWQDCNQTRYRAGNYSTQGFIYTTRWTYRRNRGVMNRYPLWWQSTYWSAKRIVCSTMRPCARIRSSYSHSFTWWFCIDTRCRQKLQNPKNIFPLSMIWTRRTPKITGSFSTLSSMILWKHYLSQSTKFERFACCCSRR